MKKMGNKEKDIEKTISFHRLSCTFHSSNPYGSEEMDENLLKKSFLKVSLHQR